MSSLLDLNHPSFQLMVKRCSFSDILLQPDRSLSSIVKIFSSLQRGLPLCLLAEKLPGSKVEEIRKKLLSSSLENIALLFLTSGTTKEPKIVKLTKESLLSSALHNHPDWALTTGDRYMLNLPLHHIAGVMVLLRAYVHGALVLLDDSLPPTHISLVPTQLIRPVHCMRAKVLLGGGPIPFALCQKAASLGLSIFPTYGMTEMSSQITTHHFSPSDTELLLGHPLQGRELKVDETGEIFVRGKTLFAGYVGEEEEQNRWFATKDIGKYDHKGLRILGRKDRMFISGGENIHPEEVERALIKHPQIYAALVKGEEDLEWGKRVVAYYAAIHPVPKEELKEFLLTTLPPYKVPKEWIFSPTSAGKGIVCLD